MLAKLFHRGKRTGLLVGLIGGVLTAGAVLFTLNGGAPLLNNNPTLALVAPARLVTLQRRFRSCFFGATCGAREGVLGTARSRRDLENRRYVWRNH